MRMGKRLYSVIMFLAVSVLGGLLTAGMLVPVTGMATTAGTGMVESLDQLPTALRETKQWERSKLLNADGTALAYFYDENRVLKPLKDIAKIMQQAQVAIEDHRFYEHGAMDLQGTLRALVSTSQGNTQGGSSLTQQYVRLVLVEQAEENNDDAARNAATENTLARKVRELRYAIAVEKKFSKDQILENYLNIAYYGDGAYGVEAAARHYFGVPASKLNLPQAAMLAGLVRNPVQTNPRTHPQLGIQRRNDVLDRMAFLKVITPQQAAEAKATKFDPKKVTYSRKGCANSKMPFICDYALEVLKQKATALGTTTEERLQRIYRGGLTITTEIDPKAQKKAQKVVSKTVHAKDPAIGVVVMMDPQTGLIKAMAQSRPEMGKKNGGTYYNYAVGRDYHGADGFQGGSTFKMFVAAAALENGYGVRTSFDVKSPMDFKGRYFPSCSGSVKVTRPWPVRGATGHRDLYSGTSGSVNGYFVQLEQKVGLCKVTKMAKRVGLQLASGEDIVEKFNVIPSFTLGAAEITPLSMITAFGTMANRGERCNPVIIKSIKTPEGNDVAVPSAGCKQVVAKELADAVNRVFQGPFTSGTLSSARIYGYKLAGKTGTVPDNKAIWTVGYTPNLVTAAVISYDNSPKYKKYWKKRHGRYLSGVRLPKSKTYLGGAFGSDVGRLMWRPAMTAGLADIKRHDSFVTPTQTMLNGDVESVPDCSGMSPKQCRSKVESYGFDVRNKKVYSATVPAGGLVGTSRTGDIPKGSSVSILISKGPKPPADPGGTPSSGPSSVPGRPGRPR